MATSKSIASNLKWGLSQIQNEDAALEARLLLAHATNRSQTDLHTWPERTLSPEEQTLFEQLIQRRAQGEPIAYILGEQGFWSLDLKVTPDVLIPRPETELLVETVLNTLPPTEAKILDLGTGSGAIACALASERSAWSITAVDFSSAALDIAQHNARQHQLSQIEFIHSNWFENVTGTFDAIVSNPPYIDPEDIHLKQGDLRFEPQSALSADQQGLGDIQRITQEAKHYLKPSGWLFFEHGFDQKEAVQTLLKQAGFTQIQSLKDLNQNWRVSFAKWA